MDVTLPLGLADREIGQKHLKLTAYDQILSKQAALSSIITKCATENRAASPEEVTQLNTIKADIEATRSEWEQTGRNAFLATLAPVAKADRGQVVLKSDESFAKHLEGTYPDEYKNLSMGKLLRGYVTGDWSDAALEMKAMGSTPLSSGGLLIPTPLSGVVIDLARNLARTMQAGAIVVPMETATLRYARLTQDVAANWTLEAANIQGAGAGFDSVIFTAHKLASLVVIANELLEDAKNSDAVIQMSIAKAIALALDLAALYGSGVAPQPLGLSGIVPVITAGADSTHPAALANYDVMLRAIASVREANFEPNAVIYSPRTADSLARLKAGVSATDMRQLIPPVEWAALTLLPTNQVSNTLGAAFNESEVFIGQWDQLALGLRSTLQVEVSREAGYFDGTAQQSAFSRDQTVIRAILRADWQTLHAAAFAQVTGILAS